MSIRAAFFDLDDTLCDDAGVWWACARETSRLGHLRLPAIDADVLAAAFMEISEGYWLTDEPLTEKRTIVELRTSQWREALGNIGAGQSYASGSGGDLDSLAFELAQAYGKCRSHSIALFPDAITTLEALRARHLRLALITNGIRLTHTQKIAYLGLEERFDFVVIADAVGYFKPDPRIFAHALDLCECSPSEAIMVGDSLECDIAGAQSSGIHAYWYNPSARDLPFGAPSPIGGELRSLSELLNKI